MRKKHIRRRCKARKPSQKPRLPTKKVEFSEEELAEGFVKFMGVMAENRKKLLIEHWVTNGANPEDIRTFELGMQYYNFNEGFWERVRSVPFLERISEHQRAKEKQT